MALLVMKIKIGQEKTVKKIKQIISITALSVLMLGCSSSDNSNSQKGILSLERTYDIEQNTATGEIYLGTQRGIKHATLTGDSLQIDKTYTAESFALLSNVVRSVSLSPSGNLIAFGTNYGLGLSQLDTNGALKKSINNTLSSLTNQDFNNITSTAFITDSTLLAGIYNHGLALGQVSSEGELSDLVLYSSNSGIATNVNISQIVDIEVVDNLILLANNNGQFNIARFNSQTKEIDSFNTIDANVTSDVTDIAYNKNSGLIAIASLNKIVTGNMDSSGNFTKFKEYNRENLDSTLKSSKFLQYKSITLSSDATKIVIGEAGNRFAIASIDSRDGVISNVKQYTVDTKPATSFSDSIFSLEIINDIYVLVGNETDGVTVENIRGDKND